MSEYRFSNLLGSTYRGGNLQFTPDGNSLLCANGNRVSVIDLVQGRTVTLEPEALQDISVLTLCPNARLLLLIDHGGRGLMLNFVRGCVLCRINFKSSISSAVFSPDGKWLAVTHGRRLQFWKSPSIEQGWQLVLHRQVGGHIDDITDVSWAANSMFVVTCSRDMTIRMWSLDPVDGFKPAAVAEHRSQVRGAFFSADSRHLFSLSRDGWMLSLRYEVDQTAVLGQDAVQQSLSFFGGAAPLDSQTHMYCQAGTWTVAAKAHCNQPSPQKVMRCAFDMKSSIFAAAFSGGVFMLYEMPGMQALQTLTLGRDALDAISLGPGGDWLAVGSAGVGQLLVWEWRSETFVLKQQGHHWGVQCAVFSPAGVASLKQGKGVTTADGSGSSGLSGRLLATGGYDGKVKLFNSQSGLCFVTFADHTAPVSALAFTPQGNAIISASKDGSVRAFDLLRYRNFRTFVSPDGLCQFASVAVDSGGEIVAASALGDKYAVYVWSIQTGNILEVLTGHKSYVHSVQFSPSPSHPGQLATASWDSTIRVWDLYATKGGSAETLQCSSSALCVAFDPRGNNLCACACLAGHVLFWNVSTGENVGTIEGLRDIRSGRQWGDQFSATHQRGLKGNKVGSKTGADGVNLSQHYNSLSYTRSGEFLLCGSRNSPHVCLYHSNSHVLAMRFTLTRNKSLSGVLTTLNSKNMTEAGVAMQELDVSDSDADDIDIRNKKARWQQSQQLPGVNIGEAKDAYAEREFHIWAVAFSADSQQFAVATTHGVFIYVVDSALGGVMGNASSSARFVPQMLTKNVSAPAVLRALKGGQRSRAMILALALNDVGLLRMVYEDVPPDQVSVVVASIGAPLLPALIWFLSLEIRPGSGTPHLQFHLQWVQTILDLHLVTLLDMAAGKSTSRTGASIELATARTDMSALCLQLYVELSQRHAAIARVAEGNTYLLDYLGQHAGQGSVHACKRPSPDTADIELHEESQAGAQGVEKRKKAHRLRKT